MSIPYSKMLGVLLVGLLAGCAEEEKVFHEVKRPRDVLKATDVNLYLKIVNQLPGQSLPELPPLFTSVPKWEFDRELSVQGLVKEERLQEDRPWLTEAVIAKLQQHHELQSQLEKYSLSTKQFLGLAETICMAACRVKHDSPEDLNRTVRVGKNRIARLMKVEDVFSNLPLEQQYEYQHEAAWIARVDRAVDLLQVPLENVEMVRTHWETIAPFVPEAYRRDPMLEVLDSLQVYGLPFEELPRSGQDENLSWSRENNQAIVGRRSRTQVMHFREDEEEGGKQALAGE